MLLLSRFSWRSCVERSTTEGATAREILAAGIVHAVAVAVVSARGAGTKGDGHGVHRSERGGGECCGMVRNSGS